MLTHGVRPCIKQLLTLNLLAKYGFWEIYFQY